LVNFFKKVYDKIMRWVLRSKIHQATVTAADVNYIGSITIDEELIEKVGCGLEKKCW